MKTHRTLLQGLLTLGLAAVCTAQDEAPRPGLDALGPAAGADPQQELIELFQAVERRLSAMGDYLLDAGAGDTAKLTELGESGMLELLQQGRPNAPQPTGGVADLLSISQAEGQRALEDIERILEIAAQNGESIGASSSPPSQPQESNQASQSQQRGGQKEEAPGAPQPQQDPSQQDPSQQGQDPRDQQGQGEQPRGGQDNPEPTPVDVAQGNPDDAAGEPLMVSPDREQWGNLPIHMQELFRAEGGDKMPPRYRDWIESYYRRLNDR